MVNLAVALWDYYQLRQWEAKLFARTLAPRSVRMSKHFTKVPVGYLFLGALAIFFWAGDFLSFIEVGGYQGYKQTMLEQQESYHQLQVENVKSFNRWNAYEDQQRKSQDAVARTANASIRSKHMPVEA